VCVYIAGRFSFTKTAAFFINRFQTNFHWTSLPFQLYFIDRFQNYFPVAVALIHFIRYLRQTYTFDFQTVTYILSPVINDVELAWNGNVFLIFYFQYSVLECKRPSSEMTENKYWYGKIRPPLSQSRFRSRVVQWQSIVRIVNFQKEKYIYARVIFPRWKCRRDRVPGSFGVRTNRVPNAERFLAGIFIRTSNSKVCLIDELQNICTRGVEQLRLICDQYEWTLFFTDVWKRNVQLSVKFYLCTCRHLRVNNKTETQANSVYYTFNVFEQCVACK